MPTLPGYNPNIPAVNVNQGVTQGGWPTDDWAQASGSDKSEDSGGDAIAVGDDVTITGTIIAINPSASHYDDIEIVLTEPADGPLSAQRLRLHPSQVTLVVVTPPG